MSSQQRRIDDPVDPWMAARGGREGPGAGSLFMATLLGLGIGLLVAPQPGSKTRKILRKRLAALSEGVGESLEDVQEVSSQARKRAQQRLAKLRRDAGEEWEEVGERWQKAKSRMRDMEIDESDEDSSPFGSLLAMAAGVAATYFMTSDRAAPVRSRVQSAASDVRRRANDQWDRFQRGGIRRGSEGGNNPEGRSETRAGTTPSDDAPQAG